MTRLLTLALLGFCLPLLKADDAPPSSIKVTLREGLVIKGTFMDQLRNQGDTILFVTIKLDRADNATGGKTIRLLRVPFYLGGTITVGLAVCLVFFADNRWRS